MSYEEDAALVVKAGMEQLFKPLQNLLDALLGPAATEVGLGIADTTKVWRFKRQVRLLQEVKRFIEQSGEKEIKSVAPRLFFPVLDAASIEDDDEMQTRWAALIANEATNVGTVHPSFVEILKQLAPADARLLDTLYDHCTRRKTTTVRPWVDAETMYSYDAEERQNAHEAFSNLLRLGLIQPTYELISGKPTKFSVGNAVGVSRGQPKLKDSYELTDVACRFVQACRAPRKKEAETAKPPEP